MDQMTTELAEMRRMVSETYGMVRDLKAGNAVRRRKKSIGGDHARVRVGL